ncbi:uncharacterized protein TRIADDRAFT_56895 [Trichoplax adhaerens]|uniref:Cyclic nucleotide-binding domain-containing protein n=1 Tax=Trichoplax adhaerens TaxID=10228 RepID=B3RWV8_TRIAD|nr:hypothetical protein TRIADDRAFT_56895 [Trichoplax adhaerens]EDV24765.1 hypothetical protein TRIADDRAFT_56895 [Trichoplax adhaerens]|eukprot:XP_002112655.1 hypothetical protein TRIADDRAFT_56895 [Trichoplax adhaerens]
MRAITINCDEQYLQDIEEQGIIPSSESTDQLSSFETLPRFNIGDYKVRKIFTIPKNIIKITRLSAEQRSSHHVSMIRAMLRPLPSFGHFTTTMQDKLCKIVRHERFQRGRIIYKLGHYSGSYYMVFSGSVCLLNLEAENALQRFQVLRRGEGFGDSAFLRGGRRKHTAVCLELTDLLVIDRDDYNKFDIDKHLEREKDFQYKYFRKMDLFSSWSDNNIKCLLRNHDLIEYYSNQVIVEDSKQSEWIVFILKGKCQQLRLLNLSQLIDHSNEQGMNNARRQYTLEDLHTRRDSDRRFRANSIRFGSSKNREMSLNSRPSWIHEGPLEIAYLDTSNSRRKESIAHYIKHVPILHRPDELINPKRPQSISTFQNSQKTQMLSSKSLQSKSRDFKLQSETFRDEVKNELIGYNASYYYIDKQIENSVGLVKKNIHRYLNHSKRNSNSKNVQVYVNIGSLSEKSCFGLDAILDENTISLALVSSGCVVTKISKSLFRLLTDKITLSKAEKLLHKVPTDESLAELYCIDYQWRSYKNDVLSSVMKAQKEKEEKLACDTNVLAVRRAKSAHYRPTYSNQNLERESSLPTSQQRRTRSLPTKPILPDGAMLTYSRPKPTSNRTY